MTKQETRTRLKRWLGGLSERDRRILARMAEMPPDQLAALTQADIEALYDEHGGEA